MPIACVKSVSEQVVAGFAITHDRTVAPVVNSVIVNVCPAAGDAEEATYSRLALPAIGTIIDDSELPAPQ